MAKLKFVYSVMNAGKSTHLLQLNHNYHVYGNKTLILTSVMDSRSLEDETYFVKSGLGVKCEAIGFSPSQSLNDIMKSLEYEPVCIIVDEAQFLSYSNVQDLCDVVDYNNIPVVCYGLRTDAFGNFFEGSEQLLKHADKIEEIKQLCFCKSKATHMIRYDKDGNVLRDGTQVMIGSEDMYLSVCRKHWKTLENVKPWILDKRTFQ